MFLFLTKIIYFAPSIDIDRQLKNRDSECRFELIMDFLESPLLFFLFFVLTPLKIKWIWTFENPIHIFNLL